MCNGTVVAASRHYHKHLPEAQPEKCQHNSQLHRFTPHTVHYKNESSTATPIFRETYQNYHNLQSNLEKYCNNLRGAGAGVGGWEHILIATKYSQLPTVCHHQDQSAAGPSENVDRKVVVKATYSECHMHFPPLLPLAPSVTFSAITTARWVQIFDIQIKNILQNTRTSSHNNSKWQAGTTGDGDELPWPHLVIIQFD